MPSRAISIFALALVAALIFTAGWFAREYALLNGPRYALSQALRLSSSSDAPGELPAGTILYEYRTLPEISTFVVFVNSKRRDTMRVEPSAKPFLVSPIEAY